MMNDRLDAKLPVLLGDVGDGFYLCALRVEAVLQRNECADALESVKVAAALKRNPGLLW